MIISKLRDHFLTRYKIECLKRSIKEVDLENSGKVIAMLIYNAVYDTQSRLGTVENSVNIPLTNSMSYPLPLDFGLPKEIIFNNCPLHKKTTSWINKHISNPPGDPLHYSIIVSKNLTNNQVVEDDQTEVVEDDQMEVVEDDQNQTNQFYILLSPSPSPEIIGQNLFVSYEMNFSLFDPANDTDAYDMTTVLIPSVYDEAILRHMIDSMFYPEEKPNYKAEIIKLMAKQFSGEKLDYHMDVFSDGHRGGYYKERHGAI